MILRRLLPGLAPFAMLLPAPVMAQGNAPDAAEEEQEGELEGSWALRIDGANIFRFDLRRISADVWRGSWARPDSFGSNGVVFTRPQGEEEVASMAGLDLDGEVELSFDDPRPGAIPDIFRFELVGQGQALLTYIGTGLAPYPLVQVAPGAPLGPFDEDRVYDRDNAQTIPDYDPAAERPEPVLVEPEPAPDEAVSLDEIWPEDAIELPEDEDSEPVAAEAGSEDADVVPEMPDAPAPEENRPSLIGDDFLDGL